MKKTNRTLGILLVLAAVLVLSLVPALRMTARATERPTVIVGTPPTASAITYGQSLADSTLTGGEAVLDGTPVEGAFAWASPETKPAVSDSEQTEYDVVFTPTDTGSYDPVQCKVKLSVNRAAGSEAVISTDQLSCGPDTIQLPGVEGQEYVIVPGGTAVGEEEWGSSVLPDAGQDGWITFKDLRPAAEYDIYTRTRATENTEAGEAKKVGACTLLSGVGLDFDSMLVGAAVTAVPEPESENLTYKWYQDEVTRDGDGAVHHALTEIADESGASYTLRAEDVGKYIAVKIFSGASEVGDAVTVDPVSAEGTDGEGETVTIIYDLNGGVIEDWQEDRWQEDYGGGTVTMTAAEAAEMTTLTVPGDWFGLLIVTPPENCEFTGFEVTHAGGTKTVTGALKEELTDLDFTRGATVRLLWEERYYTLTLHASTVDGDDMVKPISITVGSGTEFEDALRQIDPSYDYNTSLFTVEGYSDEHHYRRHGPMSKYLAYGNEDDTAWYFDVDYVPRWLGILDNTDIYYILTKPLDTIELTVEPPVCGTETTTPRDEETGKYIREKQTNPPQCSIPDGAAYRLRLPRGYVFKYEPFAFWNLTPDEPNHPFEGTFLADTEYTVQVGISALTGYDLNPDGVQIVVNGGELTKIYRSTDRDYLYLMLTVTTPSAPETAVPAEPVEVLATLVTVRGAAGQEYLILPAGAEPTDEDWRWASWAEADGEEIDLRSTPGQEEDLKPLTQYEIYTRMAATETAPAGEPVKTAVLTGLAGIGLSSDSEMTRVGTVLTVETEPDDPGLTLQWFTSDGAVEFGQIPEERTPIDGQTGRSLTLTPELVGKTVGVFAYAGDDPVGRVWWSETIAPAEPDVEDGKLTVLFDANGGEGTMAGFAYDAGVKTRLPSNEFTRSGYYFAGWNTRADGTGAAFADRGVVQTLEGTLYAQWKNIYNVLEGANAKVMKGPGLVFRTDGDYSKFTGIRVDGREVPSSEYESMSGSTVVILKPQFVSRLAIGSHTIAFLYTDGACETTFEVLREITPTPIPPVTPAQPEPQQPAQPEPQQQAQTKAPYTGQGLLPAAAALTVLLGGAAALTVMVTGKKSRQR